MFLAPTSFLPFLQFKLMSLLVSIKTTIGITFDVINLCFEKYISLLQYYKIIAESTGYFIQLGGAAAT